MEGCRRLNHEQCLRIVAKSRHNWEIERTRSAHDWSVSDQVRALQLELCIDDRVDLDSDLFFVALVHPFVASFVRGIRLHHFIFRFFLVTTTRCNQTRTHPFEIGANHKRFRVGVMGVTLQKKNIVGATQKRSTFQRTDPVTFSGGAVLTEITTKNWFGSFFHQ